MDVEHIKKSSGQLNTRVMRRAEQVGKKGKKD